MMNHSAIWDIEVSKIRILVGQTDIKATKVVLVREVMAVPIDLPSGLPSPV